MKALRPFIFFCFGLWFSTVQLSSAKTKADIVSDNLQKTLNARFEAAAYPGISVGYSLPDGTANVVVAGLSDIEKGTKMKPGDVLLAGSVGKIFCAAVLLQLADEGKLTLNDKVILWLGSEPWYSRLQNAPDLTIRMLLNHSSGIPRYVFEKQFIDTLHQDPDKKWNPREQINYILDKPALFPAGEGFAYADTNYLVLGLIIEKAGKAPYYDQVASRLLKPNGLTQILASNTRRIPGLIPGYSQGEGDPLGFPAKMVVDGLAQASLQFEWTGGGYATNPGELASFAKMLYEGKFHKPATMDQMFIGVEAPKLGGQYGLGVMIRQRFGELTYGHEGFMPGYFSLLFYFPRVKASLAIQINCTDFSKMRSTLRGDVEALAETFLTAVQTK